MRATKLFTPFKLRGIELPNRVLISPMSQYSAVDGMVQDWHRFHTAGLSRGGPGSIMVEVAAVTREGRGRRATWVSGAMSRFQDLPNSHTS